MVKLKQRTLNEVIEQATGVTRGDSILVPKEVCADVLKGACLVCLKNTERCWIELSSIVSVPTVKQTSESSVS